MHIPKTAGTTLGWIAERQYAVGELYSLYPGHWAEQAELIETCRTGPPAAAIGHFQFGLHARLPAGARYVTFLRDPVDQVISMFNHLAASDDPDHEAILHRGAGFDALLGHDWGRNLQTQYLTGMTRAEVEANPGRAAGRAIVNLEREFVGFGVVERFSESVHLLAGKLGWRVPFYPTLNRSAERPASIARRDLPPAMVEKVRRANLCDIRVYAHARAVIDSRLRVRPGLRFRGCAVAAGSRLLAG
jgi:hypothetical protein